MARNKWAQRISDLVINLECSPKMISTVFWDLVELRLEALEPIEAKVYEWAGELAAPFVSEQVAIAFEIKQNHASGILKSLTDYGLLDRRVEINENGRMFIYSIHKYR